MSQYFPPNSILTNLTTGLFDFSQQWFVVLATFVSVHSFPAEEQIRRITAGLGPAGPGNGVAPVPRAGAGQDLKTDSTYGYGYYYPYSYYYPRYYAYGNYRYIFIHSV